MRQVARFSIIILAAFLIAAVCGCTAKSEITSPSSESFGQESDYPATSSDVITEPSESKTDPETVVESETDTETAADSETENTVQTIDTATVNQEPDETTEPDETAEPVDTTSGEDYTLPLSGVVIVLDPGHGKFPENFFEQVAPWSEETKKAFSTGTAGNYLSEAELNFKLAIMLRPRLEELGATVYLTREDENSISNIARAEFANDLDADLAFRIHCDGNDNTEIHGMSMLVPAKGTIGEELEKTSREMGEKILAAMIDSTGAYDRGVRERSDLTGFNWSAVPVVLVECGFMSNPEEDALLSTEEYQEKLVAGMLNGIADCFK